MSIKWYPIIDYDKCIKCGNCYSKCKKNVYEVKDGAPIVKNPDNCVEGCKGCGGFCPTDAISYFGDNGKIKSQCSCGGNCKK